VHNSLDVNEYLVKAKPREGVAHNRKRELGVDGGSGYVGEAIYIYIYIYTYIYIDRYTYIGTLESLGRPREIGREDRAQPQTRTGR